MALIERKVKKPTVFNDCFCGYSNGDKTVTLVSKTAHFKIHADCLEDISDELFEKAAKTGIIAIKNVESRVVEKALKFTLNPEKYESKPLTRQTRFQMILFAAKFDFPTEITDKMLKECVFVKLLEYSWSTADAYLLGLLVENTSVFPEVERSPDFLKMSVKIKQAFLSEREDHLRRVEANRQDRKLLGYGLTGLFVAIVVMISLSLITLNANAAHYYDILLTLSPIVFVMSVMLPVICLNTNIVNEIYSFMFVNH